MSPAIKRQPKLKSSYKGHVEKAIEYGKTIEDWDNLMDPQTLAFYCLGPEPSNLPMSCGILTLRRKRVSVNLVNVDFLEERLDNCYG